MMDYTRATLATRGLRYTAYTGHALSDEQLARSTPSVMASEKHESRSDRYAYISTAQMLQALRANGFHPYSAAQGRCRIPGKTEFTKHMLRLRHAGDIGSAKEAYEVILVNSHDGSSSYQMLGGIINFVCLNTLVAGKGEIEEVRVRHTAKAIDEVVEGAFAILEKGAAIRESVEAWKSMQVSIAQAQDFARVALKHRFPEHAPITPDQALRVRHVGQESNSLWNVFNRVQENLIRGGLRGRTANSAHTTTRPVGSIDGQISLNRALWTLTREAGELLSA